MVFDHRWGGVSRNHTPYCKVNTYRKYTLFSGKKQHIKKICNKEITLWGERVGKVLSTTILLHFFWDPSLGQHLKKPLLTNQNY